MGCEVTEGSQKKAKMDRTALTASPAAVARKSRLRKAFPGDGRGGDVAEEPMVWQTESPVPPWDKAELSKHLCVSFLPCCITWYPTPPHMIRLAKAFQLCKHVWKKLTITEGFIFSGKGAKLELPRQEISLCFIVMTEGQTNLRCWGYPPCRRSVPTTWLQAKNPKSSKSSQFYKN